MTVTTMEIVLTREEMANIRNTVINLHNSTVTELYNNIFGKNHIPEISLTVEGDTLTLQIPGRIFEAFLKVLGQYAGIIVPQFHCGFSISSIGKWKSILSGFGRDLVQALRP